jgi:hypothetical protein
MLPLLFIIPAKHGEPSNNNAQDFYATRDE